MTAYIRNPLIPVWAFLTAITIASWWIGHAYDLEFRPDAPVTACVLAIAAVKTLLVMRNFMAVRFAPRWLKRVTYGLVGIIFALLWAIYYERWLGIRI